MGIRAALIPLILGTPGVSGTMAVVAPNTGAMPNTGAVPIGAGAVSSVAGSISPGDQAGVIRTREIVSGYIPE